MPSTDIKMKRKALLEKYKEGTLSEKTKKAYGFPPGEPIQDLQPLWDDEDLAKLKKPVEEKEDSDE